jgi:capsular polysaccharide biosynthesis protein/Mrp family chromosome partitioning ATPase
LLIIGTGVAALVGFLVAVRLPPTYEAEARLLVGPLSGERDTLRASGELARTYAEVATLAPILDGAAQRLGLTESADSIKNKIEDVSSSDVTRLLSIRVRDRDASRSAAIANSIAAELVAWSSRRTANPEGRLRVVERASPPASSSGPSSLLIVPLAAIAGFLGALGLAALVDSSSRVVRSDEDLATVAPVPILGGVDGTRLLRRLERPIVSEANPGSDVAVAYRMLAAKIELSKAERPPRSILVLDAHGTRSIAHLAVNLAEALAESRDRVALLDGGERGEVAALFGLEGKPATRQSRARRARPVRIGRITFDRFRLHGSGLVLLRPRALPEPLELKQATEIIEHLLAEADLVVLTASPVDRSPNTLVWSRVAEATVLVAERNHTKRDQIPLALESLRMANANVIGTVLYRDRLF